MQHLLYKNFVETFQRVEMKCNIQEFLRPVDVLLYFPANSGTVLLVSEREADFILSVMWTKEGKCASKTGVRFIHLAYAKQDLISKPSVILEQSATPNSQSSGISVKSTEIVSTTLGFQQ